MKIFRLKDTDMANAEERVLGIGSVIALYFIIGFLVSSIITVIGFTSNTDARFIWELVFKVEFIVSGITILLRLVLPDLYKKVFRYYKLKT